MSVAGVVRTGLWATMLFALSAGMGWAKDEYHFSGFLDDYTGLTKTRQSEGALVRFQPGINLDTLKGYQKVLLDPVEVWYRPDAKYKGINPGELKAMTDYFRETIVSAMEPDYPIVSKQGPGVLRLRLAITGLERKKPKRSPVGYLPIALVLSAAKGTLDSAQGDEVIVVEAALEAELLDATTDRQLAITVDKRPGDRVTVKKGETNWKSVKGALDFWANKLRRRFDEAHGLTSGASDVPWKSEW